MKGLAMRSPVWEEYELIDSGDYEKLERFGTLVLARPEPQAIWRKSLDEARWRRLADVRFVREGNGDDRGRWVGALPAGGGWEIGWRGGGVTLCMRLSLTSFKHVGLFPEQAANWEFIIAQVRERVRPGAAVPEVLNLFAYTGGATLAAAAAGAQVTHVDAVKPVVNWAHDNATLSGVQGVRWIVDDALKFVRREVRRGRRYSGIVLDPPAYGRGPQGEKWVLEERLGELLEACAALLAADGFLVLNLYSMGLSPLLAKSAVNQLFGQRGGEQYGELYFTDRSGKMLPLGVYYRF